MMDYLIQAFEWAKANDNMLGAVGSILALLTLFITNGALILRKIFGRRVYDASNTKPVIDYKTDVPEYGDLPAIACLPFADRGLSDSSFADGLLDDIISFIQKDRSIAAAPRTTVDKYKDVKSDIRHVSRILGVGYVLEGSLREGSGKIRFNAQLHDRNGATIWSDRFDINASGGLEGQDELAVKVTKAVHNIFVPITLPDSPPERTKVTVEKETKVVAENVVNDEAITTFPIEKADSSYNAGNDNVAGGIAKGIKNVTSKATAAAREAHDKLDPETVRMAKGVASRVGVTFDPEPEPSNKSRSVTVVLCILGFVIGGLHRFYVGRPWTGLLYLFTSGLFFIGTALDLLVILAGAFGDGKGRPVIYWSKEHRERAEKGAKTKQK